MICYTKYYVILQCSVRTITELRNMLEATPHRRSRPAGAAAAPSAIGTSIEHKVRLSLLPSMATSTLTAYATKQAGDVERGYSNGDVTEGAAVVPIGTTILVQQSEAQPSVLSKYQVGKNHFFITYVCLRFNFGIPHQLLSY